MGSWDIQGPPSQPLDSKALPWLAIPQPSHETPYSLPDTCRPEFTVKTRRGGGGGGGSDRKTYTKRPKMCRKLLKPMTKMFHGSSAALEHSSTMAKCSEPAIN